MPVNRAQWTHPDLNALVKLFFDDPRELGEFLEIHAEELPDPSRMLLAHTSHMTVTMEDFHRCAVQVKILSRKVTSTHYSREIVLTRETDGAVVQYGIVRLNLGVLSPEVVEEIQRGQLPLGKILINRDILRDVKLMTTWKIQAGPALRDAFQMDRLEVCYGRTALIYTDGVPAIELLEVVADIASNVEEDQG